MMIIVNGQPRTCDPGYTLAQLMVSLRLDGTAVVVEVSGRIVPPDRYATTVLAERATIEFVRFVGGG